MFGAVASGDYGVSQGILRFTWVLLHLLQFCVSNQTIDPDEDLQNKPWRPIPSGRISVRAAIYLRWTLFVVCLLFSTSCGVLYAGAALSIATIAHNELRLGSHWLARNGLNAVGYASFSVGATNAGCPGAFIHHSSAARDITQELRLAPPSATGCVSAATALISQLLISLVIFTTIQAQDFKDVEGDKLIARRTLPIVYPSASRLLTAALIPIWSLLLVYRYHDASAFALIGTLALGLSTGARFFLVRTRDEDKKSYVLYNVSLLHFIPTLSSTVPMPSSCLLRFLTSGALPCRSGFCSFTSSRS